MFVRYPSEFGGALWCSLELWCFELIVILAGLLPNPEDQVSAMTVCFNTTALCFMLPLGLSTAVRCAAAPSTNHPRSRFVRAASQAVPDLRAVSLIIL